MYDHDKGTYASEVADVGEEYQHHGGDMMHHIGNKILKKRKKIRLRWTQSLTLTFPIPSIHNTRGCWNLLG